MPGTKIAIARRAVYLELVGDYKSGDPAPSGYSDWFEWAKVQHRGGLRQKRCGGCLKYWFPQELSEPAPAAKLPVCLKCAAQEGGADEQRG